MAMSRVVCEVLLNGSMQPRSFTCVDGLEANFLHSSSMYGNTTKYPGGALGRPFYVWPTTPPGTIVSVDWTDAPACGSTISETRTIANAFIASPTVQPGDVITYL